MKLRILELPVYACLSITAIGFAAPLLWLMLTSVKTQDEVYGNPSEWLPALPQQTTKELDHGREIGLSIGHIKLISKSGEEYETDAQPLSELWHVYGNASLIATALTGVEKQAYVKIRYSFNSSSSFGVSASLKKLPFPLELLNGIQLDYQPDDSWNSLDCKIERHGMASLTSIRPYPLAGIHLTSRQWRVSDDADSLRIRDEIPLEPEKLEAIATKFQSEGVRVTFFISKANRLEAAWSKIRFNYDRVFSSIPFWQYFRNSVFLSLMSSVLTTFVSALVAFAFARVRWPGRDLWFILLIATILFPPQVTLVPRFLIWKSVGAYNTLTPLWLPAAFGNAFFIFMLREALLSLPQDIENAARLDGCGLFKTFWHALIPQIYPSLSAIAIFSFLASWNDFLGPLIFINDERLYPLSFGTYALAVFSANEPMIASASALLLAVPPVICFLVLQRNVSRVSFRPGGSAW